MLMMAQWSCGRQPSDDRISIACRDGRAPSDVSRSLRLPPFVLAEIHPSQRRPSSFLKTFASALSSSLFLVLPAFLSNPLPTNLRCEEKVRCLRLSLMLLDERSPGLSTRSFTTERTSS